ncbi:MAG: flagellar basal body P-ring formation chaperone FlgA [Candidatus Muirbacterium halophilum]|nr:flagellar basal body P-ring formation chaperone FlgA [Candidatus Muirbacterium halophilum]MCK9475714.1 flagellar basal body P-ring formation chaperone FlgA [Candidatus Muirbacterium halophilum]
MKRIFVFIILFNIIFCNATILKENIIVKGNVITLGHLFEDIPSKYSDTRITDTALPGQEKRINVAYVNQILSKFNLPVLDLDTITYINVKTFSHDIKSREISDFIGENYNISFPVLINYKTATVSTDEYIFRMDRLGKTRFIVEVIGKDESILKKFVVNFSERIKRTVIVSNQYIKAGEKLSIDMFGYMELLMPVKTGEIIEDINDIKFCMAAKDLSPGTVLLKNIIDYAEIVINGSIVEAVNDGTGYVISLKLEAMQSGKYNQIINLKGINNRRKYRGRVTDENKVVLIF